MQRSLFHPRMHTALGAKFGAGRRHCPLSKVLQFSDWFALFTFSKTGSGRSGLRHVRCKKPELGGLGFGPLEFGTHQRQGAPPFHLELVFNCSNNLQDQAGKESDGAQSMYLLLSCSFVKPMRNQHLLGWAKFPFPGLVNFVLLLITTSA